MAKPRPRKTRADQPPQRSGEQRVLPMQLQPGDRLTDERGEWQVIARPHTTLGGRSAHVLVELVAQPGVTEERTWRAHERVSVTRAAQ
jgi:hypothetical protein